MSEFAVGTLVRCRGREWVVLPSDEPELLRLRPLGGSESEICGIYKPLGLDKVEPATFPPPDPDRAGDFVSARLLLDAARLSLRTGAGPFRCLGRISVRPRPYQIVPLLLGLRSDPVRLLIADDVGIGKTIEGALIARELLDRGEARRLAVLCPPHLCDQWRRELAEKFHIDAAVVRTGTIARLERNAPRGDVSIYEHYPFLVVSIDYVKSDRRRAAFLLHCPDLVIVDEAHTAARPGGARSTQQQQRHALVRDLGEKTDRHLILLTATPHSGIEESFQSLIGLLRRDFELLDLNRLSEKDREKLARHFIQRRRADVRDWLGEDTPFPERDSREETYSLSPEYERLFRGVYGFAREIVQSGESLAAPRRRVRYWTALALLRCVMSSPAAAEAALAKRARKVAESSDEEPDEDLFADAVYDRIEATAAVDVQPTHVVQEGEATLEDSDRRKLRDFARQARALSGGSDPKIEKAAAIVDSLLRDGFSPIVYCRFIATSDYVAEQLRRRLSGHRGLSVISVTSALSGDERELRVKELAGSPRRVLVCTDCLSEGVNLQEDFSAVIHYDLPWNPNRLEQREGRVDRFGQKKKIVKAILLYGRDNPIDGAVLKVLIRKAVRIHRSLGVSVPVPVNSEAILNAVFEYLLLSEEESPQLSLFESRQEVTDYQRAIDRAADREKESRTRFSQRTIKPAEVAVELEESDAVLGDPASVERFVRAACERLHAPLRKSGEGWIVDAAALPQPVRERLPELGRISFASPAPEGFDTVGRNHPLTAALAELLLDAAFDPTQQHPPASRCGVVRTAAVQRRTTLLLLRIRFSLGGGLLAEEALPYGFTGRADDLQPLDEAAALELVALAESFMKKPGATRNLTPEERRRTLDAALAALPDVPLKKIAEERARRLLDAHRRVRRLTAEKLRGFRVEPYPPDILGLYVLLPIPGGVR